jgi:hypothetical protein
MEGRKPIFEIAPESLDGVECRGGGRKEEQPEVGGKAPRPRAVTRPILEEAQVEAGWSSGGKMVEEEWKPVRSEGRQVEKEALAGERLARAVQGESLGVLRRWQERLDATSRDPTTQNGQEPPAPFVLDPQPPLGIALRVGTGDTQAELSGKRGLELRDGCGLFFGWERRGAVSFAFNL